MSTVKISELPNLPSIAANTSNTLFLGVDLPTGVTGKFTATTLAQQLYANNILNVGNNNISLPNTIAQFSLKGASYVQTNLVNLDDGGTADIVVTGSANTGGTDSTYFTDLGFANYQVQPGLEFNNLGTALSPKDGYLYVQGALPGNPNANGGNLLIGTTSVNTEIKFIGGGHNSENIVAKITADGFKMVNGRPIYFTDGSIQNTAAATIAYSQAAFSKANNALANTTGTFAGDLTLVGNLIASGIQSTAGPIVTGNLIINGTSTTNGTANIIGALNISGIVNMNAQVVITNTSFSSAQSAVTISATPNVTLPSQDGYMIHISGKQNVASRIVTDSFGANTYVVYAGRTARGNVSNPSAVQSGDVLSRFSGNGYGTTKYQPFGTARIDFVASENYTDANTGSQIQFWNCPAGTNTVTQIATFNGTSVTFTGTVTPQKGFIYTPLIYAGAQTAITIDITNNSLVRAQTSSGLVVTLSNLLAGKEVVAWITNTAAGNQTFTHGVSALNSSVNALTYTIPGTSTIMARYMCIDGTIQNTFVAVVHA
jgi:hypothetical protein